MKSISAPLFWLFRLPVGFALGFGWGLVAAGQTTSSVAAPPPRIVKLDGDFTVGKVIRVEVENLTAWAAGHDVGKLIPYINGRALNGTYPMEVHISENHLHYELDISPKSRDAWMDVLGPLNATHRPVEFSLGLEGETAIDTLLKGQSSPELRIVQQPFGWISLVMIIATFGALVGLAQRTDILRDSGPSPAAPGKQKPYNLGRVQMAFWFFLTFSSYLAIWLITDAIDTITPSLLGLMGISAGTALSEVLIDANKDGAAAANQEAVAGERTALTQAIADAEQQLAAFLAKPAPAADDASVRDNLNRLLLEQRTRLNQLSLQLKTLAAATPAGVSRGFLRDVLADGAGYGFHRFQIFAWTIGLGGVFLSAVYNNLAMPEFSATLLGLMGMSSGTYVGFKFPEQR